MKLGTDEFGKIFLGDDYVERIYQGDDQIYSVYKDPKDAEIVFRPTDNKGQLSVDDPYFGYAKIDCVKGKSLVWNQLIYGGQTRNGVTATYSNGIFSLSGQITHGSAYLFLVNNIVVGHKYYWFYKILSNPNSLTFVIRPLSDVDSSIFTAGTTTPNIGLFGATEGDDFNGVSVIVNIFDLTLMFGVGHEPSTVEEFEAMFPLPYYSYNPGTFISNDAETLETVGFNQWDEEWRVGVLNGSGSITPGDRIVSLNKIPVIEGQTYHFRVGINDRPVGRYETYDANGNFISYVGRSVSELVIPTGVAFIRFCTNADYGTTYNNDICVNISDPSKNGTYEPYWKSSLPLNLDYLPIKSHNIWDEEWELGYINDNGVKVPDNTSIRSSNYIEVTSRSSYYFCIPNGYFRICWYDKEKTFLSKTGTIANIIVSKPNNAYYALFYTTSAYGTTYKYDICINVSDPDFNGQYEPYALRGGLKGAGTVYDLGRVEDDGYIHEVTKRIGMLDLGDIVWTKDERFANVQFYSVGKNFINERMNILCPKYVTVPGGWDNNVDKTIGLTVAMDLIIVDNSYTSSTAGEFKTAMSGAMLYYELATPITYELVTPIKAIYKVDKRGTEQATFPTHSDGSPSAPLCAEIGYPK